MMVDVEGNPFCYLKPFTFLLRVFGMYPCSSKRKTYKAYVIILIIVTLYAFIASMLTKESSMFVEYPKIMKSIDEIYNLLLFVCCTVSQIYMVFLHPQKVQEILQAISTTENAPYKNISPKSLFWIAFCVISIEAIAVLTADTILWTDMERTVLSDRYDAVVRDVVVH
ncbi:unnamed protein product [Acanthoscelides obtectus]|uniref:Uncharacterized protein n=1 Tax=Acanthoscelides obtectus TaxID=200917 RepID=A0A9P0JUK8_ACAOB|nr:unnamed protein product [Acanthoscelides obtectus]CAK1667056.1 hypothetical protein AOBTE_LOCUS25649 [Acanthoscelides obtectus]